MSFWAASGFQRLWGPAESYITFIRKAEEGPSKVPWRFFVSYMRAAERVRVKEVKRLEATIEGVDLKSGLGAVFKIEEALGLRG
jgi:hypothetical protein